MRHSKSLKVYVPLLLSVSQSHNEHPRVVLSELRAENLSEGEGQEEVPITDYRRGAVLRRPHLAAPSQVVALCGKGVIGVLEKACV